LAESINLPNFFAKCSKWVNSLNSKLLVSHLRKQEGAYMFSPLIYSYTISFSEPTLQRAADWITHKLLHQYHKWLHRGKGWGHQWQVFSMHKNWTMPDDLIWGLFELYISQMVTSLMVKLSNQLCGYFKPGGYLLSHTTAIWRSHGHSSMLDRPEK